MKTPGISSTIEGLSDENKSNNNNQLREEIVEGAVDQRSKMAPTASAAAQLKNVKSRNSNRNQVHRFNTRDH